MLSLDLDYADYIVLLFDSFSAAQAALDRLCDIVPAFGMQFAPSKCKVMLQDMTPSGMSLSLGGEQLQLVKRLTYLGSCISGDATLTDEVSATISRAMLVFRNLGHLWR